MINKNEYNTEVPIQNKVLLNFKEAADYAGIGENLLRELAKREENSELVLRIGSHTRIKRVRLEEFLLRQEVI